MKQTLDEVTDRLSLGPGEPGLGCQGLGRMTNVTAGAVPAPQGPGLHRPTSHSTGQRQAAEGLGCTSESRKGGQRAWSPNFGVSVVGNTLQQSLQLHGIFAFAHLSLKTSCENTLLFPSYRKGNRPQVTGTSLHGWRGAGPTLQPTSDWPQPPPSPAPLKTLPDLRISGKQILRPVFVTRF